MSAEPMTGTNPSIDDLLPLLAEASERCDATDAFVETSVQALADRHFLEALVPVELGGAGERHATVANLLRRIAHACPSTALSLSMHQHLVAAAVWRWRRDRSTQPLLKRVASEHLLLVSTGGKDWLESNGTLTPVDGGYHLNAVKPFASGSPAGKLVVTSARLEKEVLHFAVPLSADGVSLRSDWKAMGMRGTGSNTIVFENVFVPEGAITLRREAGKFHPVWSVVLTVALPLIMSVYVGVAERAAEIARQMTAPDDASLVSLGLMFDSLTAARLAVNRMIAICNDFDFAPAIEATNEVIACKTIAAREAVQCVDHAIAAVGGRAYYRSHGLERLARDIRAAAFHPLPELKQATMSGRILLGLDPV
jgi:alkylation response protein AidB-like acyl-CoA dehydrogenase